MSETIRKSINKTREQLQEIYKSNNILNQNKSRFKQINRHSSTAKAGFNYTSEYVYPDYEYSEDYEDTIFVWKNWEIELGKMPLKYVPFVQANLLTQQDGGIDYEDSLKITEFGQYFNLIKTFRYNDNGKVYLTAGFSHRCIQGIKLFKVAINVQFYSPLEFY